MKPKEYLSQLQRLRSNVRRLNDELRALDAAALHGVRYDKVNVQVSPENQLEAEIIRKEALRQKYEAKRDEYYDRYLIIVHQINELHAIGLHKDILTLRYVDGKPFWKIADELNYDLKYIVNCHGKALKEFGDQWLN